jgi:hypothetical protein
LPTAGAVSSAFIAFGKKGKKYFHLFSALLHVAQVIKEIASKPSSFLSAVPLKTAVDESSLFKWDDGITSSNDVKIRLPRGPNRVKFEGVLPAPLDCLLQHLLHLRGNGNSELSLRFGREM